MSKRFVAAWVVLALIGSGAAFAAPAPLAVRSALVVDDDRGWDHQQPYVDGLREVGVIPAIWDVARQGEPSDAVLAPPDLVVWVTGGQWNDLSAQNARALEQRIRHGRNTVVAGKYTGKALNWGFLDRWLFGFEFRDTTFFAEPITGPSHFGSSIEVQTDFGMPAGGQPLYTLAQRPGGDPSHAGQAVAVSGWCSGARVAWVGFDLRDVFSSFDQRAIVRQVLWYVSFDATKAVTELVKPGLSSTRRAFLLDQLRDELLREGPEGGPATRALGAAARSSRLLQDLRAKVRRAMFSWPAK